jgi:hypothetical protein
MTGRLTYAELLADLEAKVAGLRPFVVDLGLGDTVVEPSALRKLGFALPADVVTVEAADATAPPQEPRQRRFYGLSRIDASVKCIRERKTADTPRDTWPMTTREMWTELEADGFPKTASDPAKNIGWDLKQRASKLGDVLLVGGGRWGMRDWYTDEEVEQLKREQGGMAGRDSSVHREKTREGMAAIQAQGVRIGAAKKMTPEVQDRARLLIAQGCTVGEAAKELGVSKGALYLYGITRTKIKEASNAEPLLRLVK